MNGSAINSGQRKSRLHGADSMQSGRKFYYCPSCRYPVEEDSAYCTSCETARRPLGWTEDIFIGRIIGKKYRLDKRISSGGFGVVFLATQLHQEVEIGKVIVKILHPEHNFDPVIKKRFINEAKAARSLQNAHIVKVFDLDFDRGMVPFMVQEYVEGKTLSAVLSVEKKLSVLRSVNIAIQIAEGMCEAHKKGILHRDLKPDNIIIQDIQGKDFVKLIDFGIAKLERQTSIATASFIGTPRYMSPEQIKGEHLDGRCDIYSLGVILFEMITGEPPIEPEGSEMDFLRLNVDKNPRKITQLCPDAPQELSDLVNRMLKKNPDDRPASFSEVISLLTEVAETLGWRADHTGTYKAPAEQDSISSALENSADISRLQTLKFDKRDEKKVCSSGKNRKKWISAAIVTGISIMLLGFASYLLVFKTTDGNVQKFTAGKTLKKVLNMFPSSIDIKKKAMETEITSNMKENSSAREVKPISNRKELKKTGTEKAASRTNRRKEQKTVEEWPKI